MKTSQNFKYARKGMVVLTFVLIMLATACSSQQEQREIELKPYTLYDLVKGDLSNVSKITIQSGETGDEKTFEDQDLISSFIKNMEDAYFTPDIKQEARPGWTYKVSLYEGKKKVLEFYPTYVDGIYFKPDEKVVSNIEKLFSSQ